MDKEEASQDKAARCHALSDSACNCVLFRRFAHKYRQIAINFLGGKILSATIKHAKRDDRQSQQFDVNFMAELLVAEARVKLNDLASDKALKESLVNLRLVEFALGL